jgi:hypothetical protein
MTVPHDAIGFNALWRPQEGGLSSVWIALSLIEPLQSRLAAGLILGQSGTVAICVGNDFGSISSMTRLSDYPARSIV